MTVVTVKRIGALGDVILSTPIVEHLIDEGKTVQFITAYPDVFKHSPVTAVTPDKVNTLQKSDVFVDLDNVYENNPHMHIVDAYANVSGFSLDSKQQTLWIEGIEPNSFGMWNRNKNSKVPYIVVHPSRSWPNRTLDIAVWTTVVRHLLQLNYDVYIVGSSRDTFVHPTLNITTTGKLFDVRGLLNLHQIVHLINYARCFVGMDSGLLHLAGTTSTPIIGVFTCCKSEYRLPYRWNPVKGEEDVGYHCTTVKTKLDCYGCHHNRKPPVTDWSCPRGDLGCINSGADSWVKGIVLATEYLTTEYLTTEYFSASSVYEVGTIE